VIIPILLAVLSASETRGQQIFTTGNSGSGRAVVARVGEDTTATAMACATCHGIDGRGTVEGGVRPPDIRWETLSARYDAAKLKRAIAMGIAADGHRLDRVMPRYQLLQEEARDLIAFLQKLGTLHDPGIDDTSIAIGIVASSDDVRGAARAWAQEVNANGGVYGRKIVLRDAGENAFAILADSTRSDWAAAHAVPLIRGSASDDASSRFVFTLGASLANEQRALAKAAANCDCALVPSSETPDFSSNRDVLIATSIPPSSVRDHLALTGRHRAAQWSMLSAARLLEQMLQRAGRDLSRDALIAALESAYRVDTGFGELLTFDRTNHNGTSVVHVLRFDHETGTIAPLE
jgi:cytochrome c553